MASVYNLKGVHKDGKAELKIGLDENSKIIDGVGKEIIFKNDDDSPAIISIQNMPYIPEDANEKNKLVTQKDLQDMSRKLYEAMRAQNESMEALIELAKIVGSIDNGGD